MEQIIFCKCRDFINTQKITHGAIMNLGIDSLREINAAYGIEAGDRVIQDFSKIIIEKAGEDHVYRMEGSDEFVILFDGYELVSQGEHFFTTIQNQIADSCKEKDFPYTVSAGMVFFPEIGENAEALFTCAEYALNRAKEQGKNRLFIYNTRQYEEYIEKMGLMQELQRAVRNNFEGFELYYQPVISMETHKMQSAEALLRWKNHKYPGITPAQFIPVLEESGLMLALGRFIVEQAMRQQVEWEKISPGFIIHINLSYVQFNQGRISDRIRLIGEQCGVDPANIMFEITESGLADQSVSLEKEIDKLVDMGYQIALDDFGTGYSNFIYLKDLKIHMVKLDKVFISEAVNNANKRELLANIVNVVHSMGMEVCFEGIENMEEFALLSPISPEVVQGYVFGVPLPAVAFASNFKGFMNQEKLQKAGKYKRSDETMVYLMNEIREGEKKTRSLNRKGLRLLMLCLPILFLIITITGLINYQVNRRIILDQLDDKMEAKLNYARELLDHQFSESGELASSVSYYVNQTLSSAELTEYERLLDDVVTDYESIAGCGIWLEPYVFQNQKTICPYVYKKGEKNILTYYYGSEQYNYFTKDYYERAKESRELVITAPYYDNTMDATIITFSYPIINKKKEFLGTVTVDLYVDDIQQMLKDIQPTEGGIAFLTDGKQEFVETDQIIPEELTRDLVEESGKTEAVQNGDTYIIYYETMTKAAWKTAIAVRKEGLYRPLDRMLLILVAAAVITFLMVAAVYIGMLRIIRKQRLLELEREDNLNKNQFKALRYSYLLIVSVLFEDESVRPIYLGPHVQQQGLGAGTYTELIQKSLPYIYEEDRKDFEQNVDLAYIREQLKQHSYISSIGRMQLPGEEAQWTELSMSYTIDEQSGKEGFLYMLRNIDEQKQQQLKVLKENQYLIQKLREKNEALFRVGITDKLTGLYNRDGLDYYAPDILKKAEKEGFQLFLMIADVNKLKDTNDRYGHLRGDEVIQEAAAILSELDPENLLTARVGGDEFAILGAYPEMEAVPEQVLSQMEENMKRYGTSIHKTGISYGYYWGRTDGSNKLDYYYDYADQRMYEMKKRDRK